MPAEWTNSDKYVFNPPQSTALNGSPIWDRKDFEDRNGCWTCGVVPGAENAHLSVCADLAREFVEQYLRYEETR